MATYGYVCECGHETLISWPMATYHLRPQKVSCEKCGALAPRAIYAPQITCDVPEHFNDSIGQPVRSRRHLTDLQKRSQDTDNPFRDYEPIKSGDAMRQAAYEAPKRYRKARENLGLAPLPEPIKEEIER